MPAKKINRTANRIVIGIEGSGFLWNMVRIMVGTLVQVGLGNVAADEIPVMLAARDRTAAGPTAPPHGLYLQWIRCKPMIAEPLAVAEKFASPADR